MNAINGNTIVVDGITYQISPTVPISSISIGKVITFTGQFNHNNILIVIAIVGVQTTATPTVVGGPSTPVANSSPSPTPGQIVLEGPVQVIKINIITIYNTDIWLTPEDPVLKVVKVGNWLRVKGNRNAQGIIIATVVTPIANPGSSEALSVTLNGAVQTINGNTVTVNGIIAQIDPSDPILKTIKVGHYLSLEGNFRNQGNGLVLVVVNLFIINNGTIIITSNCWCAGCRRSHESLPGG